MSLSLIVNNSCSRGDVRLPDRDRTKCQTLRAPANPFGYGLLCTILIFSYGCNSNSPPKKSAIPAGLVKTKVVAQGQILPASGFIKLSAQPGDVVEKILVSVGETVRAGTPLLRMRSEQVTAAKIETLLKRKEQATHEMTHAESQARLQVEAVELSLAQLDAQAQSLARRKELLASAKVQVDASEQMLRKLESIAKDKIIGEFVGQLEIDRQKISVRKADLDYQQQLEAQRQAEEDLQWARRTAEAKLSAAQESLVAARTSPADEVLQLEILALEKQAIASKISAPIHGVILAINANPGEASVQLPLVEMADVQELVCEVEINEIDAADVHEGQSAQISLRALGDKKLSGRVDQKFSLVGRPQLRSLDPLARNDFRAVTGIIKLDAKSSGIARDWLQLQVEVEIAVGADPTDATDSRTLGK